MPKVALFIMITLSLCTPPFLGLLGLPPAGDGPRLVLFPPWKDGIELVRQAGGDPIGPGRAAMGVLAFAPDYVGFDQRLRNSGAWAVIDGTALARLCGISATLKLGGTST